MTAAPQAEPGAAQDWTWPAAEAAALEAAGLDPQDVRRVVAGALAEDLRYGPDATTLATVPAGARVQARAATRRAGAAAGIVIAAAVLRTHVPGAEVTVERADGDRLAAGDVLLTVSSEAHPLLTVERTVLNLLGHLSGIATVTRAWVDAVAGTGCTIRDTRKTTPGLRLLDKYAVRCGGGANHRLGLGDAVLVKDNHIAVAGSVTAAVAAVRAHAPHLPCEVEVGSLAELDEALAAGVDLILLDNFDPAGCAEAVRRVSSGSGPDGSGQRGRVRLEASGGITLDRARAYAETGVDYLAIGALTHSAPTLDIGLDL